MDRIRKYHEHPTYPVNPCLNIFLNIQESDMKPKDYEIAKKLKERLSEVVPLIDFRVFGSRARGDADEYSDMDVFVEVESLNKELKEKIPDIFWEVGFEYCIVISSLLFTRDELENSPLRSSPIVRNIIQEGVVI